VTITLWLLRHFEAATESPTGRDHDRPLTDVGEVAARSLRGAIADRDRFGPAPEIIVCSPAQRTRSTAELVFGSEVTFHDARLYEATADDLVAIIHEMPDMSVLGVVGHNPAIAELVLGLADPPSLDRLEATSFACPPGTLSLLSFDVARPSEVAWGQGRLELIETPRP
jgi:phosphohistidine phosphatase